MGMGHYVEVSPGDPWASISPMGDSELTELAVALAVCAHVVPDLCVGERGFGLSCRRLCCCLRLQVLLSAEASSCLGPPEAAPRTTGWQAAPRTLCHCPIPWAGTLNPCPQLQPLVALPFSGWHT